MKKIMLLMVTICLLIACLLFFTSNPALAEPVRGGVIRLVSTGPASSYNPQNQASFRTHIHSSVIFNGLVRSNPEKADVTPDNLIPDLAERWEISPDAKIYTFYLRKGVKFHDGHPFTAKDVKYSLDRFRDPKQSRYASLVTPITSVDIIDDYTVKIQLKHPYPYLLSFLLPPACGMLPEHLKDVDHKTTDFMVGTGPFKFKQHVPGKVTMYERNPDYFLKGLPYLDGYDVYYLKPPAHVDAFIGGELDLAGNLRILLDQDIAHVMKVRKYTPEAVIGHRDSGTSRGIYFNLERKGPWNDVRVRKALGLVVNYHDVLSLCCGGHEMGAIEGAGLVRFDLPGAYSKEEVAKALGTDKEMKTRIAEAKRLMKEAGYEKGFKIEAIFRARGDFFTNTAVYLGDMWKRYLNVELTVKPEQSSVYYGRLDKLDFDITLYSAGGSVYLTNIEFLFNFVTGDKRNYGKWANAEYDAIVNEAKVEVDDAKIVELMRKAQKIFYAELPYIPLGAGAYGTAWRPDLMTGSEKGVVIQPMYTTFQSIDHIWFAGTPDAKKWMKK